jgi:TRAP-type transport system periplasmic protein
MSQTFVMFLLIVIALLSPAAAQQSKTAPSKQIVIKMGTLAPKGSPWYDELERMGERWRKVSAGGVKLILYPGGMFGDEPDMVNKMRVRQLQAVALSGAGMSEIDKGVACLQIPMMLESYEELDYVRDRMAPTLEEMIEKRDYLVLNWGDAGWVHFFSKKQAVRLDDLRRMKLFTWAGDNDVLELWKANGFQPVPLAATDIIPGLKTGLIEVVPTTPLYAELSQLFGLAKFMNDVKWAPLVGGTVIRKDTWNNIPQSFRDAMRQEAREAGSGLRGGIRQMDDRAVAEMVRDWGLQVIRADAAALADWRKQAEGVYGKLRGKTVPANLFDQVRKLRDEFRARPAATGGAK